MNSPYILLGGVVLVASACAPPAAIWSESTQTVPETPKILTSPETQELAATPLTPGQRLSQRVEVQAFIREMAARHHFSAAHLHSLFSHVQVQPSILAAITKPAEAKPWYVYREIFLNDRRIQGGVRFWRENASALARSEQVYGVPPQIIVAIIGVETQYGSNMGKYRVLEALATLAFDYPRRSAFFRKELENYLLLTRAEGVDPLSLRGSYAGAMGFGQFMPSSFLNYAVDFDGDGHRDLWRNPTDAIGSVAYYFMKNGWRSGHPVAIPVTVRGNQYAEWVSAHLTPPKTPISTFRSRGVLPQEPVEDHHVAMLLEFAGAAGPEYWLGFDNFYAITRYNRSQSYALAVYQLSQAIRAQYFAGQGASSLRGSIVPYTGRKHLFFTIVPSNLEASAGEK